MNNPQWERAHKIAQDIHAADLAWGDALQQKIAALKVNDFDTVRDAEETILRTSITMARHGVTLATLVLELGPSPVLPTVSIGRLDAYPSNHPGFTRVLKSIEQHDPIGMPDDSLIGAVSPEQDEHLDDEQQPMTAYEEMQFTARAYDRLWNGKKS